MTDTTTPARVDFKPTPEMIAAAENLFLAMAYEGTVRPIVEGYQRSILAERNWTVDLDLQNEPGKTEYVTNIKAAWTMTKDDFAVYQKRCNEERVAAKLVSAIADDCSQDDYCPLLVAEEAVRVARFALCDAMACITKIDGAKARTLAVANCDKLVDLSLRLLAPFVTNPLASLEAV